MVQEKLYNELARYYDLFYQGRGKNYKKEAETIMKKIKEYKKSSGKDLLDVACGTGMHIVYFKKHFNCEGLDVNKGMLKIAKKRLPNIKFHEGDMTSFNLNKKFDVITCLFSSVGYVKTYSNLKKTIKNLSKHLKPGGVLIIEPWFTKKQLKIGIPFKMIHQDNNNLIIRMSMSKLKKEVLSFEIHFLIAERNKGIKYFKDTNKMGVFEIDRVLNMMHSCNLKSEFLKKVQNMRGLYVSIKKQEEKGV